ncbi:MAG: hypothetical protein NTV43_16860 [Methylococcales bacterium]|nr:hypothetical protein [Methylococcales bacterium]
MMTTEANPSKYPLKAIGFFACSLLVLAIWSKDSPAEPKANPAAAQALQKTQGMLRQLNQEKQALLAEKTAMETKLKQLETEVLKLPPLQAQLDALTAQVDTAKASLATAQQTNTTLQTHLQSQSSKAQQREQDLQRQLQETISQAELIQKDNELLAAGMQEREQWIKQCGEKNQKLFSVNSELVQKYQEKGFWDKVADMEPLTGIGKVQTENVAEEYQYKLEDLKTLSFTSEVEQAGSNPEKAEKPAQ